MPTRDQTGEILRAVAVLGACAFPGFLTGALIIDLREDIALSETGLGVSFAVYWGAGSAASVAGARIAEHLGSEAAMRLAAGLAGAASLAVAALARSPFSLIAFLALGGLSIALATPAVSAFLARRTSADHRGLAFGLMQSSVPGGLLLAGLAVPAIAVPLGWRWAFGVAAGLAAVAALAAPSEPRATPRGARHAPRAFAADSGLLALALAAGLGTAAVAACNAFLVAAATTEGLAPTAAGVLTAGGAAASIVLRVATGVWADRVDFARLAVISAMLVCGALGSALVALGGVLALLVGAALVLTFGWAWLALLFLALVERYPHDPERATGVVSTAVLAGAVAGPLAFGALAELSSYRTAWWLPAACSALAGGTAIWHQRTR